MAGLKENIYALILKFEYITIYLLTTDYVAATYCDGIDLILL